MTSGGDAVVVLNYGGRDDTLRCVESLVTGSPTAEVIVVDNGSDDGVLADVQARWPEVAVLQTGTNLGFSGGVNVGLTHALGTGARTVTVLNNDTVTAPGLIAALARRAAGSRTAVSPEVRYVASGRVWFGAGTIDDDTGLPRHLSDAEITARFAPGRVREVETLAGCCITASADTWQRVGLFDERFFLLFEDAEWSLRARRVGVRLVVDPEVHLDHAVSASFTGVSGRLGLYYYSRNGLLFGAALDHRDRVRPLRGLRFLRHHVVVLPLRAWRRGERRDALRAGVVVVAAVAAHLVGRYGRAPRRLERWLGRERP